MAGQPRAVVMDNGAGNIKLGLAGEELPHMVFPNCTAKAKGERSAYVGDGLLTARDIMSLNMRRPFDRGYLVNWELEREVWWRALRSAASSAGGGFDPSSSAGLVLTEPLFNFPPVQAATEEVVFEEFGFPRLFAAPSAWFALRRATAPGPARLTPPPPACPTASLALAAGAGVVVDVGFSAVSVAPFFDGRLLPGGVRRLNLGGKALTNLLKDTVSYRSLNMQQEGWLMEMVKEQLCWVSQDVRSDLQLSQLRDSPHRREYVLPDGVHNLRGFVRRTPAQQAAAKQAAAADAGGGSGAAGAEGKAASSAAGAAAGGPGEGRGSSAGGGSNPGEQVLVLNNELFMVPEVLFRPNDIGSEQAGVAEVVLQSVKACAPLLAPLLYSNVLLVGGCAKLPGFRQRCEAELRPLVPDDYELGLTLPQDPDLFAWQGASAFGCTRDFFSCALTKQQYMEQGPGRSGRR